MKNLKRVYKTVNEGSAEMELDNMDKQWGTLPSCDEIMEG